MDEVTFLVSLFQKHYPEKPQLNARQMKIEEAAASSSRKSVMENSVTIP